MMPRTSWRSILTGLFLVLGGAALGFVALRLPDQGQVEADFARAEQTTRLAVRHLQHASGTTLREAPGQLEQIERLRDALGAVADGLSAQAKSLDRAPIQKLAAGFGETADYLDQQLIVGAEEAAKQLEHTAELLRGDARRLIALLKAAPLNVDGIQAVHDALDRFVIGTEAFNKILELEQMPKIREGLAGMDSSLSLGAGQVENLASYTYPVIYFERFRPIIDYKPFWPDGTKIAQGMRKASEGIKAADKELQTTTTELPKVRAALESSRQIMANARDTLATALKNQELVGPLVKSLPETASRMTDHLSELSDQLAKTLRGTSRLRETATGLRAAQARLEQSVADWPKVQKTLTDVAEALRLHREQLDQALASSDETSGHGDELAALGNSLEQVADTQKAQGAATGQLLFIARWLLIGIAVGMVGLGFHHLAYRRSS